MKTGTAEQNPAEGLFEGRPVGPLPAGVEAVPARSPPLPAVAVGARPARGLLAVRALAAGALAVRGDPLRHRAVEVLACHTEGAHTCGSPRTRRGRTASHPTRAWERSQGQPSLWEASCWRRSHRAASLWPRALCERGYWQDSYWQTTALGSGAVRTPPSGRLRGRGRRRGWGLSLNERTISHGRVGDRPPRAPPGGALPRLVGPSPPAWEPAQCAAQQKRLHLAGSSSTKIPDGSQTVAET